MWQTLIGPLFTSCFLSHYAPLMLGLCHTVRSCLTVRSRHIEAGVADIDRTIIHLLFPLPLCSIDAWLVPYCGHASPCGHATLKLVWQTLIGPLFTSCFLSHYAPLMLGLCHTVRSCLTVRSCHIEAGVADIDRTIIHLLFPLPLCSIDAWLVPHCVVMPHRAVTPH